MATNGAGRIVRVTRTIEYIGDEAWVKATLARSTVTPDGCGWALGKGRSLREIAATGPEDIAAPATAVALAGATKS